MISGATQTLIAGNLIGLGEDGATIVGNELNGVVITNTGASGTLLGNTIGGTASGARNVISGNGRNGVAFMNAGASGNTVLGNYIGTDVTGMVGLGNALAGVAILNGGNANTIGGTAPGSGNVVSGNYSDGIRISVVQNSTNVVEGNYIGTDKDGTGGLGNLNGVTIDTTTGQVIGGLTSNAANLISANNADGVMISGFGSTGNTLEGNLIGTTADGTKALGNKVGVAVVSIVSTDGISANTVGGVVSGATNVISGNLNVGILIDGPSTSGNLVAQNLIGTDELGANPLGNGGNGIQISTGASNNLIGDPSALGRNVISGNGGNGLLITGANTRGNKVQNNYIGLTIDGGTDFNTSGNSGDGISIEAGASSNTIGGAAGSRNVISQNDVDGVRILAASMNTIIGNTIGTYPNSEKIESTPQVDGLAIQSDGTGTSKQNQVLGNVISGNSQDGALITGPRKRPTTRSRAT